MVFAKLLLSPHSVTWIDLMLNYTPGGVFQLCIPFYSHFSLVFLVFLLLHISLHLCISRSAVSAIMMQCNDIRILDEPKALRPVRIALCDSPKMFCHQHIWHCLDVILGEEFLWQHLNEMTRNKTYLFYRISFFTLEWMTRSVKMQPLTAGWRKECWVSTAYLISIRKSKWNGYRKGLFLAVNQTHIITHAFKNGLIFDIHEPQRFLNENRIVTFSIDLNVWDRWLKRCRYNNVGFIKQ